MFCKRKKMKNRGISTLGNTLDCMLTMLRRAPPPAAALCYDDIGSVDSFHRTRAITQEPPRRAG